MSRYEEVLVEGRSLLIVEDDALLRELVAGALETRGFRVTTAATAADAMRAVHAVDPDGALVDIDLGEGPTGFDFADRLLQQYPHVAIVFLTNLPDPRFADRDPNGLPRGVAYLRKSAISDVDAIIAALDSALRGGNLTQHRHDRNPKRPLANLTRRQIDVLRMVVDGKTNAQIADARGVTLKSVEATLQRAYLAIGIAPETNGNSRVLAARRFLEATEPTVRQLPAPESPG